MTKSGSIALIGPMCAGKSTIGKLLSAQLGMDCVEADEHRWAYFEEIGYDHNHTRTIMKEGGGYAEMFAYWKPFEVHLVERLILDFPESILDFGAGHSVHEKNEHFERVQEAFSQCRDVVYLLPAEDLTKCLHILNHRLTELLTRELGHVPPATLEQNHFFLEHPSNQKLATQVVYTETKSPQQTAEEIVALVS